MKKYILAKIYIKWKTKEVYVVFAEEIAILSVKVVEGVLEI
jgi:hypothetical protein